MTPFVILICVLVAMMIAMFITDHLDKRVKNDAEKAALRAQNDMLRQRLARYEGEEDPATIKAGCTD